MNLSNATHCSIASGYSYLFNTFVCVVARINSNEENDWKIAFIEGWNSFKLLLPNYWMEWMNTTQHTQHRRQLNVPLHVHKNLTSAVPIEIEFQNVNHRLAQTLARNELNWIAIHDNCHCLRHIECDSVCSPSESNENISLTCARIFQLLRKYRDLLNGKYLNWLFLAIAIFNCAIKCIEEFRKRTCHLLLSQHAGNAIKSETERIAFLFFLLHHLLKAEQIKKKSLSKTFSPHFASLNSLNYGEQLLENQITRTS